MSLYVGLDVGTTAVKALAIDEQGRVRAQSSREYAYYTPQAGWAEQDAEDWWRLACECVREVVLTCSRSAGVLPAAATAKAGETPALRGERVVALSISTQGDTMVPLDASGAPLLPAITWMDTRTLDQVAAMRREEELWFGVTGATPAAFAAATSLLWWREHQPQVFAQAQRFALVADFIAGRLTGRYVLDAPNASRTLIYDIQRRDWSEELLQRVGVGRERLPETAESGTVVGTLLPEVAADLGLSAETLVVLGGHDQTCAAVGCGVIKPGSLLLSCGTAWVVLAATEKPLYDDQRSLQGYCHAVPGGYAALGAFAGGNLLKWFRDTFWEQWRLNPGPSSEGSYEAITAEAAQALAEGRPPLVFLSHFYGTLGPVCCAQARGAWAGLTLQHTRGDLALSLLDGVALQTAWTVQNLARQGASTDDIRMIGGGSRSRFWTQLVADALQTPINLPHVSEAAAYGAALIAATAAGAFDSLEQACGTVHIESRIEPVRAANPQALERRKALLEALVPVWEELQGI